MKTEYPLIWPDGFPRSQKQVRSPFRGSGTLLNVISELESEVRKIKGRRALLYTDMRFDTIGEPVAPLVPMKKGAVVVCEIGDQKLVFACDKFDRLKCNIRSIAETIHSYRKIKNYGTRYQSRPAGKKVTA